MTKKPPSRIRYERSHPVVSARLSMEDYKKLMELKRQRGVSLAQLIREIIGTAKADFNWFYRMGYEKGYKDGYRRGRIEAELERLFDLIPGSLRKTAR